MIVALKIASSHYMCPLWHSHVCRLNISPILTFKIIFTFTQISIVSAIWVNLSNKLTILN